MRQVQDWYKVGLRLAQGGFRLGLRAARRGKSVEGLRKASKGVAWSCTPSTEGL